MIMQSDAIEVRVDAPVGTIVINRPQRANALTRAMVGALRQALADLYAQRSVRAVVLTGAGDVFCAGRDVHELAAGDADRAEDLHRWGEEADELRSLLAEVIGLPKPVIASVNGPALGAGAALVAAADAAIACEGARFGAPDARLGLAPGVTVALLAFRFGAAAASRLGLTATPIEAPEAHRLGVYQELVPEPMLWARAAEIGRQCAAASPEALAITKRLIWETLGEHLSGHLTGGVIAEATSRTTESAQEGLRAFVEKRPPNWP